jgi:hypothetical protein
MEPSLIHAVQFYLCHRAHMLRIRVARPEPVDEKRTKSI